MTTNFYFSAELNFSKLKLNELKINASSFIHFSYLFSLKPSFFFCSIGQFLRRHKLIIVPDLLELLASECSSNGLSVHLVVQESGSTLVTIEVSHLANSFHLVFGELTAVFLPILPLHSANAMGHVLCPVAFVRAPILKGLLAFATSLVIQPGALVAGAIGPLHLAVSTLQVGLVISHVGPSILINLHSEAIFFVKFVDSLEFVAVEHSKNTISMLLVFRVLARVGAHSRNGKLACTLSLATSEVTLEDLAIRPGEETFPMEQVIEELPNVLCPISSDKGAKSHTLVKLPFTSVLAPILKVVSAGAMLLSLN